MTKDMQKKIYTWLRHRKWASADAAEFVGLKIYTMPTTEENKWH